MRSLRGSPWGRVSFVLGFGGRYGRGRAPVRTRTGLVRLRFDGPVATRSCVSAGSYGARALPYLLCPGVQAGPAWCPVLSEPQVLVVPRPLCPRWSWPVPRAFVLGGAPRPACGPATAVC